MSAPFTPGPWAVEEFRDGSLAVGPVRPDGSLDDVLFFDGHIGTYHDEARAKHGANYRLIAAAPELYEHLEWLLNSYDLGVVGAERTEKLLAKARGES